ncbi:MAG: hypothetical protein RKH07_01990 [Gammaproteobacteria bacterium]
MGTESNERKDAVKQLIGQAREFVQALLKEDGKSEDITFALAFVAADLGLRVTDNQVAPISVVNAGVNKAIKDSVTRQRDQENEDEESEESNTRPKLQLVPDQIH